MSKIVTTLGVVMLSVAASAIAAPAQDYRSPDARPVVAQQDYRSPDARQAPGVTAPFTQDLRSPDAFPSGAFQAAAPTAPVHASGSFDWSYVAIAITAALMLLAGVMLSQRRRRHGLATGS